MVGIGAVVIVTPSVKIIIFFILFIVRSRTKCLTSVRGGVGVLFSALTTVRARANNCNDCQNMYQFP